MEGDLRIVGTGLYGEVAAAAGRLQGVAGERWEVRERRWPASCQDEPIVEQRRPQPEREGQPRSPEPLTLARLRRALLAAALVERRVWRAPAWRTRSQVSPAPYRLTTRWRVVVAPGNRPSQEREDRGYV